MIKSRLFKITTGDALHISFKDASDHKYAPGQSSIITLTDQKAIIHYAGDNFRKISQYIQEKTDLGGPPNGQFSLSF